MVNPNDVLDGFLNNLRKEFGIEDPVVEAVALERLAICNGCTFRSSIPKKINAFTSCKSCGCLLGSKARSNSDCPEGFWPKKNEDTK